MATEKRMIDAYLNGEVPKIKTHFAEIIVRGETEKPYYNIIFIDPQTREYEVCFGSYFLENVRKWLSEEFEIVDAPTVDAVEVVHGRWAALDDDYEELEGEEEAKRWGCSACREVVEYDDWTHRSYLTRFCPNCGAKMDGERKDNG